MRSHSIGIVAERKMREAVARGELDNLKGHGKPLNPEMMAHRGGRGGRLPSALRSMKALRATGGGGRRNETTLHEM